MQRCQCHASVHCILMPAQCNCPSKATRHCVACCVGGNAHERLPSLDRPAGSKRPAGTAGLTVGAMQQQVQVNPQAMPGEALFPAALTGQHAVNSMLNQRPGKLCNKDIKVTGKPHSAPQSLPASGSSSNTHVIVVIILSHRDQYLLSGRPLHRLSITPESYSLHATLGGCLQAAIAVRKQELQLEHQQLEELLQRGTAAGVDPLDDPSVPPAVKVKLMNDAHHGRTRAADAAAGCGT